MVQEEEPVEEAAGRVHIHDIEAHKRASVKDLSWYQFFDALQSRNETALI